MILLVIPNTEDAGRVIAGLNTLSIYRHDEGSEQERERIDTLMERVESQLPDAALKELGIL